MKLQHSSLAALIVAGSLILGLSAPRNMAATRYVWLDSPSPSPPYTTWATAAHVIQEAVDAAQAGETVLVTNGIYAMGAVAVGDNQTNRVALTNPIVLLSVNGPDVTVIQGGAAFDGGTGDGAIRCVYVASNALLSGFTLTNGHAGNGGGVWCEASGVVSNCTLTGNSAYSGGGADSSTLYNCTLTGNSADYGGGAAGGTLHKCTLVGNSAEYHGGGAYSATLYSCALRGNSVRDYGEGGGTYGGTLYNCTLTGNSASRGGGADSSTLYNCTLTGNSAEDGGGAAWSTLYNCIVYFNAGQGNGLNYSDASFHSSCTTPLPPGAGNIDADPQLASATHLSATSPCIGAGSATNASGVDIDGEPWADPPCMGADQLVPGNVVGPILVSIEAAYTNMAVDFAAAFIGLLEGRLTFSTWDFGDGTIARNQAATGHAWAAPGTYTVTLRGFNDSHPEGVAATIEVIVVERPVHYVNQTNLTSAFPYANWPTAATNIQDAVDAATVPGSLILVTNGVYDAGGGTNESRVALTKPVVLRSVNGPEATMIAGSSDWEAGIMRCAYVGADAILSGFTITKGLAWEGGGVWCESSGMVSNCVLTGNRALRSGGGAFGGTLFNCTLTGNYTGFFRLSAYGGGAANAALYNCVLANNVALTGGGAANCTLHHCILTGNSAVNGFGIPGGGGAYGGTLYNCTLSANWSSDGGGAYGGTLYKCILSANSAWYGGGTYGGTLNNCVLTGNSASNDGGGAYGGTLNNCTLTDNRAETGGGAYGDVWNGPPATLHNCIVYHNTAQNGPNYFEANFEYSCTTPLPTNGVGNIDADPQLASASHLSSSSPCIGAGNASYSTGVDIDGEPWANPPCMGADQLTPGNATGVLAMQIQASAIHVKRGDVVAFTALNKGPILRSVWDFGDGTRLTNRPFASHAWSALGIYTVRLTGYNDSYPGGITTSFTITVSDGMSYVNSANANPVPPYTSWETAATNIQDAIEVAAVGGVVWVTNGVYANGGRVWSDGAANRVAINRALRVRSVNGAKVTVIEGAAAPDGGNGEGAIRCVYVGADAILSGFTLTNGHAGGGGGVLCEPSGTVSNCVLIGNSAGYSGGGAVGGTLINCVLTGNSAEQGGGGAWGSVLHNCTLTGNSAGWDGGGAWEGTLHNCTLTDNSTYYWAGGGATASTLKNCIVYFNHALSEPNYSGCALTNSCTTPLPEGEGNIDSDPQLASATHLSPFSPCIGAGDAAYSSGVDIDGEPWANPPCMGADQIISGNALGPITVAIETSTIVAVGVPNSLTGSIEGRLTHSVWDFGDGTQLTNRPFANHAWNALGTYTVTLAGFNDSHPEGVSAAIQVTVVEPPVHYVNRANTTPVFPYASWPTAATHIQDAVDAARIPGSLVLVAQGVYNEEGGVHSSRVTLTRPVVLRSANGPEVTSVVGSGLRCAYVGANATLSGFTLTNGVAGEGGGVYSDAFGIVTNCVIVGNSAGRGGGAFGGRLYDCAVADNSADEGAGISGSTLYNCTLTGNLAVWGGGAGDAILYHCVITGNSARMGGGGAADSVLYNSTLTANWAGDYGGGGVFGGRVRNSIVYFNITWEVGANYYPGVTFEFSCTTPLPPGEGNIDADPRLVNLEAGDLRLRPDSPCIDAGTDLSEFLTTDLTGLSRPLDGNGDGVARFDMGAYEFNPYRFAPALQITPDGFRFTIRGEPGKSVRVERSRDLVHWEFAGQVPIPASGQGVMHDPAARTESQLFYRAVSAP